MSRGRTWRRYAVFVGPLVCAVAALAALLWVFGLREAQDEYADADEELAETELAETVSDLMETLSGTTGVDASSETFLEELAELAERELDSDGDEPVVVTWEERSDLVDVATRVVEAYAELEGASLATSGYLDLQGNSWGAVVRGGSDWVDIVLISTEDDETSTARIVRLLPSAVDGGA